LSVREKSHVAAPAARREELVVDAEPPEAEHAAE